MRVKVQIANFYLSLCLSFFHSLFSLCAWKLYLRCLCLGYKVNSLSKDEKLNVGDTAFEIIIKKTPDIMDQTMVTTTEKQSIFQTSIHCHLPMFTSFYPYIHSSFIYPSIYGSVKSSL